MMIRAAAFASLLLVIPAIAADAGHSGGTLLVAEKGTQNLAFVDPDTGKVVATAPEGGITGHEVVASPDGKRAYVPIYGNSGVGKPGTDGSKIAVIDTATHKTIAVIDFGHGVRPHCPVFGKDGKLYVTTELEKSITIIDPKTNSIVGSIPTGQAESHMLALSHDGRRGYTANVGPGTVSVLDLQARKTLAVIAISGSTQRISISPDDHWVFTSDQTKPRLVVIDTTSDRIAQSIPLPATGYGSAPTPDGNWLLLAMPGANQVAVIDLKEKKIARTIDVPATPQEVLVAPGGKKAYVSCDASSQVAEIDLGDWKVTRLIQTGKTADGLAWAAGGQ